MFESDDFDQVLSQFEFPEDVISSKFTVDKKIQHKKVIEKSHLTDNQTDHILKNDVGGVVTDGIRNNENINHTNKPNETKVVTEVSPKHTKRKIIHSHFDHKSKRKFPGPAGLLTGGLQDDRDDNICQIELLSQDVDFTQSNLQGDLFESPLWARLQEDLKRWNLCEIDSIKTIKQQALSGNLKRRKAHTITAFVEKVDRSAIDPLIIMRDTTGNIKGTLHRDAWSTFSKYITSEYCAFILWKPTILTTGAAFKKHYLNITLSNILAIYSSAVLPHDADTKPLPDEYAKVYEDEYTVIKTQKNLNNLGKDLSSNGIDNTTSELFDELDTMFSDEVF